MAELRVTPETLNTQGGELVSYADQLTEIITNVNTKVEEIIAGWDGLGQDGYYEMYTTMKTSLDQFPELVNGLGTATQSAAEAYATVDDTLKTSFQSAI